MSGTPKLRGMPAGRLRYAGMLGTKKCQPGWPHCKGCGEGKKWVVLACLLGRLDKFLVDRENLIH